MAVQSFDSFDEMMEQMRRDQEAADAQVKPWQAEIKAGDYFRKATGYGFPIYGEVLPEEEKRDPSLRFYLFCRCYSIACVRGEMGDVHASTIERLLSRQEFDDARKRGWSS